MANVGVHLTRQWAWEEESRERLQELTRSVCVVLVEGLRHIQNIYTQFIVELFYRLYQ
jgi:hypothetical protein